MAVILAVLGLFGLAIGSFLTTVVSRLGTGETILWGRSRCVHCRCQLRWYELLPVLSFLIQGGQCRSCGQPIPRAYLALELATAFLFAAVAWGLLRGIVPDPAFLADWPLGALGALRFALGFSYYAFFAATAVAVSRYDLAHRLIPRALVAPLAAAGAANHLVGAALSRDPSALVPALAVALGGFSVLWALWRFSGGRAMGRGDADVALASSLALGPAVSLLGFLFAFWIGAVLGIILVAAGALGWKSPIPFAPFLFAGALLALFSARSLLPFVFPTSLP